MNCCYCISNVKTFSILSRCVPEICLSVRVKDLKRTLNSVFVGHQCSIELWLESQPHSRKHSWYCKICVKCKFVVTSLELLVFRGGQSLLSTSSWLYTIFALVKKGNCFLQIHFTKPASHNTSSSKRRTHLSLLILRLPRFSHKRNSHVKKTQIISSSKLFSTFSQELALSRK